MRHFFILLICFKVLYCAGQQQNIELTHQFSQWVDKSTNHTPIHSSFKPLLVSEIAYDSLKNSQFYFIKKRSKWLGRKLLNESLIIVDTTNFKFAIDPLLYLEVGVENDTSYLYKNTRGIVVRSDIGKTVSFSSAFYESQAFFPSYISDYSTSLGDKTSPGSGIIPGQGRAKPFKNGGFDYGMASAYVSFVPTNFINFRFGHGKHFIGEGYRSVLLSDNAFNYPYLRINWKIGKSKKFEYTMLTASLMDNQRVPKTKMPEAPFIKKALTVHYLSYAPTNWLQISLFEKSMWQLWDSLGSKSFNAQLLNPIIGINTITSGNNNQNSGMGVNLKISPHKFFKLYGQYLFGNLRTTTYDYQIGLKIFDLMGMISNLTIQLEYNHLGISKHANNSYATTHYGQSLAHPNTNNVKELIVIVNYSYQRLFLRGELIISKSIKNELDFSLTESPSEIYHYLYSDIQCGFLVNPANNLNLYMGYTIRNKNFNFMPNENSNYIYLGLRTSLRNLYYDF